MKMMENEKKLLESDTKEFVLTSHRIRKQEEFLGKQQVKSIMLEELDSCSLKSKSYPLLLVVAAAGVVGAIAGEDPSIFIVTVIAVGLYFYLRQLMISLNSKRETILLSTKSMGYEKSKDLIDEVELAKNARANFLVNK